MNTAIYVFAALGLLNVVTVVVTAALIAFGVIFKGREPPNEYHTQ